MEEGHGGAGGVDAHGGHGGVHAKVLQLDEGPDGLGGGEASAAAPTVQGVEHHPGLPNDRPANASPDLVGGEDPDPFGVGAADGDEVVAGADTVSVPEHGAVLLGHHLPVSGSSRDEFPFEQ